MTDDLEEGGVFYQDHSVDSKKTSLLAVPSELLVMYLRRDFVLDMERHVLLYHALLQLMQALAICPALVPLLLLLDREEEHSMGIRR